MSLRIDAFGPDALLARFAAEGDADAFQRAQVLLHHLEQHPPHGLIELTPGFTTLLLEFEPGTRPDPQWLAITLDGAFQAATEPPAPGRTREIQVIYDGPDLDRVAQNAGIPVSEVIHRHAAVDYRVQILGFAPGFPYLSGMDPRLLTPRLDTPRSQVPAGSVAIGGAHTGVYPVATAGGWNLIGRTQAQLIDPDLALAGQVDAFLFHPGDIVRFKAVDAFSPAGDPAP